MSREHAIILLDVVEKTLGSWTVLAHKLAHMLALIREAKGNLEAQAKGHANECAEDDEAFAVAAINAHPILAEIVLAAQVVIAARHGATFAQWVAANDALGAALAKLNPKRPPFEEVDALRAQEAERIDKVKTSKGHDGIGEIVFRLEVEWDRSRNNGIYSRHATLTEAQRDLSEVLASVIPPDRWRIYRSTTINEPLVQSGDFSDDVEKGQK